MARAYMQAEDGDKASARVQHGPNFCYIALHIGSTTSLFLPDGQAGVTLARSLAAVLTQAADEQDEILARKGAELETRA